MRKLAVALALAATPLLAQSSDVTAGAIHGTLLLPSDLSKPVPVVLLIAGSGPTDRDGTPELVQFVRTATRPAARTP